MWTGKAVEATHQEQYVALKARFKLGLKTGRQAKRLSRSQRVSFILPWHRQEAWNSVSGKTVPEGSRSKAPQGNQGDSVQVHRP